MCILIGGQLMKWKKISIHLSVWFSGWLLVSSLHHFHIPTLSNSTLSSSQSFCCPAPANQSVFVPCAINLTALLSFFLQDSHSCSKAPPNINLILHQVSICCISASMFQGFGSPALLLSVLYSLCYVATLLSNHKIMHLLKLWSTLNDV